MSILSYYITAIVCLITAFVIQRIYHKERTRRVNSSSLNGIKWFGLAIFSWGLGALVSLVLVSALGFHENDKLMIYLGVSFSLLNSFFILMSLPSIEHQGPKNLVIQIIERFTEKEVFIIFSSVLVMIAFVFLISFNSSNQEASSNNVIWLIDIPISLVVAFALLNELNKAFKNRGMRFMYLPTASLVLLILIAVTHRMIPEAMTLSYVSHDTWLAIGIITALSFKFLFILLFSILLYSWKLLAEKEEQQTELEQLRLSEKILEKKNESLVLANESHLDTIKHLKADLNQQKKKYKKLKKSSKVVLSERQKEVLGNLGVSGTATSYTALAEAMHIGVDGLQTHIYQIKKVLSISGADGKNQLIAYAKEHDLIKYATIK